MVEAIERMRAELQALVDVTISRAEICGRGSLPVTSQRLTKGHENGYRDQECWLVGEKRRNHEFTCRAIGRIMEGASVPTRKDDA